MRRFPLAFFVLLTSACGAPLENQGEQTAVDRAVPPETREFFRTDGPTQPRTSPQRPPDRQPEPGAPGSTPPGGPRPAQ